MNAVHSRELLAVAFAAILGGCCATYVERWPHDMPTSASLASHLSDLRYALRSLLVHGQPLPCALRGELEVGVPLTSLNLLSGSWFSLWPARSSGTAYAGDPNTAQPACRRLLTLPQC